MRTINLAYPKSSDIKFHISSYPDGQKLPVIEELDLNDDVTIKSRLSWEDLQSIIGVVKALRESGARSIHLYTPYFLGARSDRKFEEGSINYLKGVICPIINSLQLASITVLDPHSDVLEMGLNNFHKVSNAQLVTWALRDIKSKTPVIIAPDAGAGKKIFALAKEIGYTGQILECSKHRDTQGKIEGVNVPTTDFEGSDIIIIDDICDGGRTFIELSKAIKPFNPGKIFLIVTHGLFSAGYGVLREYFEYVYTTNSVKDVPPIIIGDQADFDFVTNFVKQFNVF